MTKVERRRLLYLHAARLEAAYDAVAKVQEQFVDNMQDTFVFDDPDERNAFRQMLFDARVGVTKSHAAMLELAREMDVDLAKEVA